MMADSIPSMLRDYYGSEGFPSPADQQTTAVSGTQLADVLRGIAGNFGIPQDWQPATAIGQFVKGSQSPQAELAISFLGGPKFMGARAPIRAYHGSPYDFDKFDLSKIGTGEGGLAPGSPRTGTNFGGGAYGHGLYFAENPAVADDYKRIIGYPQGTPEHYAESMMKLNANDRAAAIEKLQYLNKNSDPQFTDARTDAIKLLQGGFEPSKGRMYEVNINASPEQFLDWDKPLGQQSAQEILPAVLQSKFKTRVPPTQTAEDWINNRYTGEDLYRALLSSGERNRIIEQSFGASQRLNEAGIPGIRYLDQGSRVPMSGLQDRVNSIQAILDAGPSAAEPFGGVTAVKDSLAKAQADLAAAKPTSNYVVFNPDIVDIIRKYGLAGLTMGSVLQGAAQPQQPVQ
jgi:hypothetical protein